MERMVIKEREVKIIIIKESIIRRLQTLLASFKRGVPKVGEVHILMEGRAQEYG